MRGMTRATPTPCAGAAGQLWLLPELEFAPYAASEIPPGVLRALRLNAQRGLFE
jgi:hypothetical protein